MKINKLNIHGGQQQFADIIINSKENNLEETDRKFIKLIHDNTSSKEERNLLLESLIISKDEEQPKEKISKAKELLNDFVKSSVGEAGKSIVRELIESGATFLA